MTAAPDIALPAAHGLSKNLDDACHDVEAKITRTDSKASLFSEPSTGSVHEAGAGADLGVLIGEVGDCDDQAEDSTASPRLRPGIRLAGSWPVVVVGTPAAAWTLWVSRTTRVGSSNRRCVRGPGSAGVHG